MMTESPSAAPRSAQRGWLGLPVWVWVVAVLVPASTCIPYVYWQLTTPPDKVFTGAAAMIVDANVYWMWIEQVRAGRLLAYNLYTSEPHDPMMPSLPWVAIGLFSRFTGIEPYYPYHAMRLLFGGAYLLLVYGIAREIFEREEERAFAVAIVALGSGIGTGALLLSLTLGIDLPVGADISIPETWAYASILIVPHFAVALAALAAVILAVLRGIRAPSACWSALAFVAMMVLTNVHPYTTAVIGPVLVAFVAATWLWSRVQRPHLGVIVWALAGIIPPAALLAYYMLANEAARGWFAQTHLHSPPVLSWVIGFGLFLPLALVGVWLALREQKGSRAWALVCVWFVLNALALYSYPVYRFERRCVEGLHLPMALLAALTLSHALPWLRGKLSVPGSATGLVVVAVIAHGMPSNLGLQSELMRSPDATIPRSWVAAYEWIGQRGRGYDALLSSYQMGTYAPPRTLLPVYLGHHNQTADYERKLAEVTRFLSADTPVAERAGIFERSGCRFVAVEKPLPDQLLELTGLNEGFRAEGIVVYEAAADVTATEPIPTGAHGRRR